MFPCSVVCILFILNALRCTLKMFCQTVKGEEPLIKTESLAVDLYFPNWVTCTEMILDPEKADRTFNK
jgi:hypothetical protein